jgi:hypothetical protein
MPFYTFKCSRGHSELLLLQFKEFERPRDCSVCGSTAERDYDADLKTVQVSTVGTRDHNKIPENERVQGAKSRKAAAAKERAYGEHVHSRRAQLAADGNKRSSFRHKMSVPAEIVHGKIKETGDKTYWDDPKNVARHKEWEVS